MADVKTRERTINDYMRATMALHRSGRGRYPMQITDVAERVYVALDEERHFERGEMPLDECIAELRGWSKDVPKGCEAVIEFEQDYGWDDDKITVRKIGYWRDPTPEERAEREEDNRVARAHNEKLAERNKAQTEAAERAEFARLKAKFGE